MQAKGHTHAVSDNRTHTSANHQPKMIATGRNKAALNTLQAQATLDLFKRAAAMSPTAVGLPSITPTTYPAAR